MHTFSSSICETEFLAVKLTPQKGRGVFAKRRFEKGELIERAPIICIVKEEEPSPDEFLYLYTYSWGLDGEDSAIALGFGSLYNTSYNPNAYWENREDIHCIDFMAQRTIEIGEEIFTNYRQNSMTTQDLWFDPVDE